MKASRSTDDGTLMVEGAENPKYIIRLSITCK
jgi:hypothetical protein